MISVNVVLGIIAFGFFHFGVLIYGVKKGVSEESKRLSKEFADIISKFKEDQETEFEEAIQRIKDHSLANATLANEGLKQLLNDFEKRNNIKI